MRHLEEKALDVPETLEVLEPVKEDVVVAEKEATVEASAVGEMEEPRPEEAVLDVAGAEEAEAEVTSEPQEVVLVVEVETPAAGVSAADDEAEEKAITLPEEAPASAPLVEEVGEAEEPAVEAPALDAPALEVVAVEEATGVEEPTEAASAVEESAEPALEVAEAAEGAEVISEEEALIIAAAHLAAASVSAALEVLPGATVEEAELAPEISAVEHCHSCHSTGPASEAAEPLVVEAEVVPPGVEEEAVQGTEVQEADVQVEEEAVETLLEESTSEGAVEMAEEAKEEGTPMAGLGKICHSSR